MTTSPDERERIETNESSLRVIERVARQNGVTLVIFQRGSSPDPKGKVVEEIGDYRGKRIICGIGQKADDETLGRMERVRDVLRMRYEEYGNEEDWIQPR